jgi:hypothetical protein
VAFGVTHECLRQIIVKHERLTGEKMKLID